MTRYAAVVLAAGQGTRFRAAGGSGPSKLVARAGGKPLVRLVAEAALASRTAPVIVVTGFAAADVTAALADLQVSLCENPDYARGLSTSLRAGLAAVPATCAGAVILLADMPRITPEAIDALVTRAEAAPEADAVLPVYRGQRANPVLLARSLFSRAERLEGDTGARQLLRDPTLRVIEVAQTSDAVVHDVDRPGDLKVAEND